MDLGSVTSPVDVTGGVLSFGAAIFGFGIGWSSYAAGEQNACVLWIHVLTDL